MASNTVEQIFVELLLNAKGYNKDADEAVKKSEKLEKGLGGTEKQAAKTDKSIANFTTGLGKAVKGVAGFAAVGVRLSVGSRVTRPGQKRIPWLTEGDVAGPLVGAGFVAVVETLKETMTSGFVLGAPAEFCELDPIVVRKNVTGAVTAHQPITGYVVNSLLTTQVSRRVGRGS